jgi:hypothetical protein
VIRRVVVRVQASVRLRADREEADRHQRTRDRQRDKESHRRAELLAAAELQDGE